MIYKGNKPLILSLNNGNSKVTRMFKGNQSIYASSPAYYPQAIGGTIFKNGEYNIHVFTGTDTFQPIVPGNYEVLLVGPGGAGATEGPFDYYPGGGGSGGQVLQNTYTLSPTTYNLVFTIDNTQFDSVVSVEKGQDAAQTTSFNGADYVAYGGLTTFTGGAGFNGGSDPGNSGGGGAGANQNGANASAGNGGAGGNGYYVDWLLGIDVEATLPGWDNYVSGGGAGASNSGDNIGGIGGGGNAYPSTPTREGGAGRVNSGGGGGGAGWDSTGTQWAGGIGGSGLCLVRYKRYY